MSVRGCKEPNNKKIHSCLAEGSVVQMKAHRTGDSGSNPGLGEDFLFLN